VSDGFRQQNGPLAERMRPVCIEDMVGQEHLLAPGTAFERALRAGRTGSLIFWGPPGSGKTTLARLLAGYTLTLSNLFRRLPQG
jgi:putative ATPase